MDIEKNLSAIANQLSEHGMTREAKAVSSVMQRVAQRYTGQDLLNNRSAEEIKKWQQFLSRQGFQVAVDGIFGPETEAATRRFQGAQGILVDGMVGPQTIGAANQEGFSGSALMTAAPNAVPAAPNAAPVASPGANYLGTARPGPNPAGAPAKDDIFSVMKSKYGKQKVKANIADGSKIKKMAQKARDFDAQGNYAEADKITMDMIKFAQTMTPTKTQEGLQNVGWMSNFGRALTNTMNAATIGIAAPFVQAQYKANLIDDIAAVKAEVLSNKSLALDPKTQKSVIDSLDNAKVAAEIAIKNAPNAPANNTNPSDIEKVLGKRPARRASSVKQRVVLANTPDMLIGDLQRYLGDFANRNVQKFGNDSSLAVVIDHLKNAYENSLKFSTSQSNFALSLNSLNPEQQAFLYKAAQAADIYGLETFINELQSGNYPDWQKELATTLRYWYTQQKPKR